MFIRRLLIAPNRQLVKHFSANITSPEQVKNATANVTKTDNNIDVHAKPTIPPPPPASFSHQGDNGTTTCLSGDILPKDHRVFKAIGATEELLSYIGLTREHAIDAEHDYIHKLMRIQTVLIDVSTAISRCNGKIDKEKTTIPALHTKELEEWINEYSKQLPPVELYIIPGGGIASASLHVARSLCRRTERTVVPLVRDNMLDKEVQVYLNRLADFLLTLSRIASKLDNRAESIYTPKGNEQFQAQ